MNDFELAFSKEVWDDVVAYAGNEKLAGTMFQQRLGALTFVKKVHWPVAASVENLGDIVSIQIDWYEEGVNEKALQMVTEEATRIVAAAHEKRKAKPAEATEPAKAVEKTPAEKFLEYLYANAPGKKPAPEQKVSVPKPEPEESPLTAIRMIPDSMNFAVTLSDTMVDRLEKRYGELWPCREELLAELRPLGVIRMRLEQHGLNRHSMNIHIERGDKGTTFQITSKLYALSRAPIEDPRVAAIRDVLRGHMPSKVLDARVAKIAEILKD